MTATWIKAAAFAAGTSLSLATAIADAQTIKIGVNEPLTGAVAASGNYVVNGARIAADEINAKGGVLGSKTGDINCFCGINKRRGPLET